MTQTTGRNRRSNATLEEVALLAGVSRATVSRVVNGSPKVSPDVRVEVQAAIEQLGYTPNRAARSLVTRRSDSIAVVITEPTGRLFSDPFFPRLLRGISSELTARDRQLILLMPESQADERRVADYLTAGHVDGALLVSLHGDDPLPARLTAAGMPIVLVGRPPKGADRQLRRRRQPPGRPVRRRPPRRERSTRRRDDHRARSTWRRASTASRGYRDALAEGGIGPDATLEALGDFTQEGSAEAMRRLLAIHPDIDAVFAASDLMAAGALSVLAAAGRQVPERRRGRRVRRLTGRDVHHTPIDQRPPTHRGDGP